MSTATVTGRRPHAGVELGPIGPDRSFTLHRRDLVRYAGSSCDYNPIHYDDTLAREVGLATPIVQGMFTMGLALTMVTDWAGDPAAVIDFGGRFPRQVPMPNTGEGADIVASAAVVDILGAPLVRLSVSVRLGDARVLTMPRVLVELA
ncbi:MaoC/PaaZ C-terminal domain-containing protein [Kutzneria sp. NPDC052558]|uniref:MaoC/PaaZ C-terminal domain-containing protein n=1 Tax=Kutzneria sp. NPDC052558 TaxID=3364121 RepID=UPI0037C92DEA